MYPSLSSPAVIVIGNFDGVHYGHQALLATAGEKANALGLPLIALTFEPHPRAFFNPAAAPARLTRPPLKTWWLKHYGADDVVILPFTAELAGLSADDFIVYLQGPLKAVHIVVGPDFSFGQNRSGTVELLTQRMGASIVTTAELLVDASGPISSSRIRTLLTEGNIEAATALLGHPHIIYSKTDQTGRIITTNVCIGAGLYPIWAKIGNEWHEMIANIGETGILEVKDHTFKPISPIIISFSTPIPAILDLKPTDLADIVSL